MTAAFWNQRFSEADYKYGTQPNAFLKAQASAWPGGLRVLCAGDGEGRNGVWLAAQGHQVLSLDYAQQGLDKARRLAEAHGSEVSARLQTLCADLTAAPCAGQQFDAVVLVYCHLHATLRRSAHRHLLSLLRPGGQLVLEAFAPQQLGRPSGGPQDTDMLYALADVRADFEPHMAWSTAWEGEVPLDEGPGHQGMGWVSRLAGVKAAA